MSIPAGMIYVILFAHYFSDFVCQTDWMALNKSSSNKALSVHIGVYTLGLLSLVAVGSILLYGPAINFGVLVSWAALNGALHFATDYVSSRMSGRAYKSGDLRGFWAIVGADQMVHYIFLFATWTVLSQWSQL